jgi:hypothetical protein
VVVVESGRQRQVSTAAAGCPGAEVGEWPAEAVLRIVKGDPVSFRVAILDAAGDPLDVSAWRFAGTLLDGARLRLDFEWAADDTGVNVWLRGDSTARLTTLRPGRFDLSCMQPAAGEGVTILAGQVMVKPRVTDPLRSDPGLTPGRDEELVHR